ncbi:chemotaxis protein CheB [Sediminibacterium soli]|uniref:chemotaxis protein CheB n=1 Tax=Sediminibacterium soli TaxID=2698829 RepID=UPI00137A3CBD|nr:chemotaxis protein CheB [Sediminibacterium soli]NCI46594.1 chemotaxis protein CheB [Sediminibacterium soli]
MPSYPFDIVLIGGSAGSLDLIIDILERLPPDFEIPLVLVVHRLKNTPSVLDELLSKKTGKHLVVEPEDKQSIRPGRIYLAPQNYHLLAESDHSFVLDYSEPIHYSRPAIDASFESFAGVYGSRMLAVLLSGANRDGADGLQAVLAKGGKAIVQAPGTAQYDAMPKAAIDQNPSAMVLEPIQIVPCILNYKA